VVLDEAGGDVCWENAGLKERTNRSPSAAGVLIT
jgi:hypothetical protein